jgi:hypothetical protein
MEYLGEPLGFIIGWLRVLRSNCSYIIGMTEGAKHKTAQSRKGGRQVVHEG